MQWRNWVFNGGGGRGAAKMGPYLHLGGTRGRHRKEGCTIKRQMEEPMGAHGVIGGGGGGHGYASVKNALVFPFAIHWNN